MPLRAPHRSSLAGRLLASAAALTIAILLVAGLVLSALHRNYAIRTFDDRLEKEFGASKA